MSKAEDIIFKVITIGDSGVGKTSILKRYVNSYNINSLATIGVNFSFKDIILKDGTKAQLKLIDTAGEEKYKSLAKTYYKNTEGVLFVFSFDDKKSFDNLTNWIDEFKENNGNENIRTDVREHKTGGRSHQRGRSGSLPDRNGLRTWGERP